MSNKFIMESFWQHPEGYNCAVVAIIKTALLQFGTVNVFKTTLSKGVYSIQLKNGKKIILTRDEVAQINRGNCIVFSRYQNKEKAKQASILKTTVQLCYAVMVEYLHRYGFKNKKLERKEAIEYFQEGYGEDDFFNTDHLYHFLGLGIVGKIKDVTKRSLPVICNAKSGMLYSYTHVVAACNGYYDDYGTMIQIDTGKKTVLWGDKVRWWYQIK